jgi:hypothetical protein
MGEIMEVRARLSDGSVLEGDVVLASLGSIRNVERLEGPVDVERVLRMTKARAVPGVQPTLPSLID